MCSIHENIDMGFTSEAFPAGTHMCLIYSSEQERRDVISKFIEKGISNNEKVGYFAVDISNTEINEWLINLGIDLNSEEYHRNFELLNAAKVYHPSGSFIPDNMLETLKDYYLKSKRENFSNTRVSGEMAWALKDVPGSDRLMEYESKVNLIVSDYPVTAICQYDANKFDGNTILECLKVHPFMIVKGQIVRNPYFIKPEEYLRN